MRNDGAMRAPLAALALAASLLCACSTTSAPASLRPAAQSSTTEPAPTIERQQLDLADPSRPVGSGGEQLSSSRPLPTTVTSPAGPGRHPLILLVHGYGVGPERYQQLADHLAREGAVVAAPSFPLEDPARGFPLDRSSLSEEARDASFVISALLVGPLGSRIDEQHVSVLGHSDGADVALLLGYDPPTEDPRISAVVAIAPDPIAFEPRPGGPPLLLVHGSADEVVPPSSSDEVAAVLSSARWSLTLEGADHASPAFGPSPWTATLRQAVGEFLAAARSGRLDALAAGLEQLPRSSARSWPGP